MWLLICLEMYESIAVRAEKYRKRLLFEDFVIQYISAVERWKTCQSGPRSFHVTDTWWGVFVLSCRNPSISSKLTETPEQKISNKPRSWARCSTGSACLPDVVCTCSVSISVFVYTHACTHERDCQLLPNKVDFCHPPIELCRIFST